MAHYGDVTLGERVRAEQMVRPYSNVPTRVKTKSVQAWRKVTDEGVTHFERDLPPGFVAPQFRQRTLRGKFEKKRSSPEDRGIALLGLS